MCSPAGHTVSPDQGGVIPCGNGYYNDKECSSKCFECEAGKTKGDPTSNQCDECATGSAQPITGSTLQHCPICDVGYTAINTGQTECDACPKGKYSPIPGDPNCYDCEEKYYNDEVGQLTCKYCPNGKFSNKRGLEECESCSWTEYSENDSGSDKCLTCWDFPVWFGLKKLDQCTVWHVIFGVIGALILLPILYRLFKIGKWIAGNDFGKSIAGNDVDETIEMYEQKNLLQKRLKTII